MSRLLLNGQLAPEVETAESYEIRTKCPSKWVLIDTETGNVYTPDPSPSNPHHWKKAESSLLMMARGILSRLIHSAIKR